MQTINHLYDDHATARKVIEELERSGVEIGRAHV